MAEPRITERGANSHQRPDVFHTGPDTLAGRWLRMFWQPLYPSRDLQPGRSVPLRVMNEDLTLYRGEAGEPHALAFRCAHRGTQLSTGWVEGDTLRCFYHGWRYDGTGQCVEQPAEPEPFCEKVRIRSYRLREEMGLIFVYLGEDNPPDPLRFPEFADESRGWLDCSMGPIMPCNYFNLIDNDPIHYYFVHYHAAAQGRGSVPTIEAEETEYGFANRATDAEGTWEYHFHMPNLVHNRRDGSPSGEALRWVVPVDDESARSFSINLIYHTPDGEAYRTRQSGRTSTAEQQRKVQELGEAILRGELHIRDVGDRSVLFNTQDFIAYVGQGVMAPLETQQLGREDAGIVMLRKIWARELQALAAGRPLKHWRRPDKPLLIGHTPPPNAGWRT